MISADRSLAAILFTDIVGSTGRAAELGDYRWRELLERHHELVRREVQHFGGREVSTAGDGFLIVFESPARALVCADAIRQAVRDLAIEVRCGVHMGAIERAGEDVGGIAVHIGARVAAHAGAGEILASSTVRDSEAGSGFRFEDRGRHELKGVPGEWRLYALLEVPDDVRALLTTSPETPRVDVWTRVKRSRLLQVLLVYVGVSWLLLQTTGLFIDSFGLPEWAMPAAALLLVIGLVVIGATAWVQSHPLTRARARAGELPRAHALDVGGLTRSVRRGEMPHLTWGRAAVGGVFAFSLLFGLAGLYVVIKDRGRSFSPPEAVAGSAAPGIAVLPFAVQGEGLDVWREGMVDMLGTSLDGAAGLRAIDSRTVLARWREVVGDGASADLAMALDVGRRTGARYVLVGSAVGVGDEIRLSAQVYDAEGGGELGQGEVVGSADSVFSLVDRLSIEVLRAVLQGREGALPRVNLARVTTSSLPALKAYLEGEVLFRRGDFDGAIPAYERAVEADSTFALANYRLATSYGWAESILSDLAEGAIERAVRYADRLPEREAVLLKAERALYHGTLEGLEPLEFAVRRYPDDPEAWYHLGETYFHLGRQALVPPEKAEEAFAHAVRLDPQFLPAYIHRVDYAFLMDDSARAAVLIDSVAQLVPEGEGIGSARLVHDLAFGDPAARSLARAAMDTISRGLIPIALSNLAHPRLLDAQAEVYEIAIRNADQVATPTILLAINRFDRGKVSAGLETVEGPGFPAVARGPVLYVAHLEGLPIPPDLLDRELDAAAIESSPAGDGAVNLFFAGAWAAEQGREADRAAARGKLRDLAAKLRVEGDSTSARFADGAGRALDGVFAWRRGRPEEAVRFLEEARTQATGFQGQDAVNQTIRWWLGEVLAEMGRFHDSERYFASMWLNPLANRRLGDLYMEMEEYEKARESYEMFLTAWRDPDPALQPLALRTRQTVAGLAPLRQE
ncbi:hypothetical protein BH18GEM1_BH18GEM1_21070 [soil metagenome]